MPVSRSRGASDACERLVEARRPLDELGEVRAQIVLALADRLDAARTSTQGIALQAVPAIAKQLEDAIQSLTQDGAEVEDFVNGLNLQPA